MKTNRAFRIMAAAILLTGCAHSAAVRKPPPESLPPKHAFSCQGFTKHADGSWWAGPNTLPFNLGTNVDITIRNAGPITKTFAVFATGENLYDFIEGHCGAPGK